MSGDPSHWQHVAAGLDSAIDLPDNHVPAISPFKNIHLRVLAELPIEDLPVMLGEPQKYAAGIPGVVRSMKHLLSQMGPVRAARTMLKLNQKGGIDCMSCAWPESDKHRHTAEFCENGAKAVAWEATTARCTPDFFAKYSVDDLSKQSDYWLGQQGRLTHPMLLAENATHYKPVTWDEALDLLTSELKQLESPDQAVFYTSGRTSNEAAFLYQLFVRQFGTNNLPDCSNMCHESSGSALSATIGIGKGTVTLEDFIHAKVILILGQNPGTNHPRMLTTLERAKKAGAKIVAINPLPEAGLLRFKNPQTLRGTLMGGTPLADIFLPVRINGDMALLKGVMKHLLDTDKIDMPFIAHNTAGFLEFAAALRRQPWESLVEQSGISKQQMTELAELLASTDRIIACWAMGLTQHKNSVATIQEIVNLLLLRGAFGKPGAGACPVRGHSNVQGDRTMGIWERPQKEFLDKLEEVFNFQPPRRHGYDTVDSIKAMHAQKVGVFLAMGGNFLSATPDTLYTAAALQKTRLTAQISIKLNRSHLVTGRQALIFPCLGRTEIDSQSTGPQFVSTENSMGVVEMSQGILKPASEHLRSEVAIVCDLAQRTLGDRSKIDWKSLANNYDAIRDLIAKVIPGCDNYNEKVRTPGGFYLPNAPRHGSFENTANGKGNFTTSPLTEVRLASNEFLMMTVRTHDQFNTTIYGLNDTYRGLSGNRRVIMMNPDDIQQAGFKPGDLVDLVNRFGGRQRIAARFHIVEYPIPRRCTATYFPEANVLVPIDSVAEKSNTPTSKSIVITLRPARA
jgi:molybdopterin-dependent oxidoreductase alpha subunit